MKNYRIKSPGEIAKFAIKPDVSSGIKYVEIKHQIEKFGMHCAIGAGLLILIGNFVGLVVYHFVL